MYLLITRNNPYLEELNKNPQNQAMQKDLEGMEIDLKSKMKTHEMEMNDCYHSDGSSDSSSSYLDSDTDRTHPSDILPNSIIKPGKAGLDEELLNASQSILKKISLYKPLIHILDITSSVVILITGILCAIENEKYYKDNAAVRICGSLIMNAIYYNDKSIPLTFEEVFDDSSVNLTSLIEFDEISIPVYVEAYLDNNGIHKPIVNKNILNTYNITKGIFFSESETIENIATVSYNSVKIPLTLKSNLEKFRLWILVLTVLGIITIYFARYLQHIRATTDVPFYKSSSCIYFIIELIYLALFQYPSLNTVAHFGQLDCIMVLPFSSLLSAFTSFRFLYILKILSALSVWDSSESEKICNKYNCKHGFIFSLKSIQKHNPFISLVTIFFLSCLCFGFCIRIFELHYWETQSLLAQNWRYHWNGIWCVFVSMTTVGYGDFYPKTHFGRIFIIFACIIGVYSISMMMIFMTQKSVLSEGEQKAYKLITRLRLRNQLKDIHAKMIYHAFQMIITNRIYDNKKIDDKVYKIRFNYEKRCVIATIDKNKILSEKIKTFDIIPTKEQLYDISERIEIDIREIKREVDILRKININFMGYTDTQSTMVKYLKRCILNTKMIYDLVEKKPDVFGDLGKIDKAEMMAELEKQYKSNEYLNKSIKAGILFDKNVTNNRRRTNPNQYEDNNQTRTNRGYDEYYAEELSKYQVTPEEFKNHFGSLFFDSEAGKQGMKSNQMKTIKAIKGMKEMKKKIDSEMLMRRGGMNDKGLVIDENSITE